jgi:pimeloyl-ACP methyl ester carboxylesterase
MRKLFPLVLALLGLTLGGCFSDSGDPSPDPETGSTGIEEKWGVDTGSSTRPGDIFALFAVPPDNPQLPYPIDLLGYSDDGTLDVPDDFLGNTLNALAPLVNQLDGYSTFGRITIGFSESISPESIDPTVNPLNAFAVVVVEVTQDPSTKVVTGVAGPPLVQGVDYELSVTDDVGAGGQMLEINPLKPLNQASGYLVIVSNRVTDTDGTPSVADTTYEQIKQGYLGGAIVLPPPDTELPPLTPEEQLGLFIAAHFAVVEGLADAGLPLTVEDTVVTTSFSTMSITDPLDLIDDTAEAQFSQTQQVLAPVDIPLPEGGVLPAGTPITTGIVLGLLGADSQCGPTQAFPLPGCGLVFAGALNLPYYLTPPEDQNDASAVFSFWEGTPGVNPLDPESINLTRYNPVANKKADVLIPTIMAVPGPNSQYALAGGSKPPGGWPVVIFQHGFTLNRLTMFPLAEGFNNAGVVVIAIDHAYHGITATDPAQDPTALFRVPGTTERTFDLDIVDNANPADPTPDGIIDSSGVHYLNPLPDRIRPSADNFRQSVSDIIHLIRTIPTMDIDGDGNPDFDGSRVHFVGQSLGGFAGANLTGVNQDLVTATLGVTGGCISCALFESPTFNELFGKPLFEGLASQGVLPGTTVFNNFIRDWQHVANLGDPLNYGAVWAQEQVTPLHMIEVEGDTVIPNSMTARLQLANGIPQVPAAQPPGFPYPVFVGGPETGGVNGGLVFFTEGDHGSQIRPTASPAATVEMQTQQVVFAVGNPPAMIPGNGQVILISNPDVVDVDGP